MLDRVTAYAGYAEANRAPTPAELPAPTRCGPARWAPSSSRTPPLKQVVSRTVETGLRGTLPPFWLGGRTTWNLSACSAPA